MSEPEVLTIPEAAVVTEMSTKEAMDVVEQDLPRTFVINREDGPRLTMDGVVCLALSVKIGRYMSQGARRRIYHMLGEDRSARSDSFTPTIRKQVEEARRWVDMRLKRFRYALAMVKVDRDILGGEPHLEGTRIPVNLVSRLLDQDVSEYDLIQQYPGLNTALIEAARYYVRLTPVRATPARQPWHELRPDSIRKRRRMA